MKLMSLFDGSGGFPLAASLCGIEPVYAAEYKMWGNGIALPNALYVMQGIVAEVDI